MGPGLHPQYTRAWYAREAVGGPSNSTSRNTAQTSVEHSADEHITQVCEQSPMMCKSPMTRKRERNSHKNGWGKVSNCVCFFVHRKKGLFLSVYVDDIKLDGKKQNINPLWKVRNKEVDLGEPTLFLDHVYLGCTQTQCKISKDIVDNYRAMFESGISEGTKDKLLYSGNLSISSWFFDMEGRAKKCVERYCELANKTTQQLYKVSTPCFDDHHVKEEELKSVRELSKVCSQIVQKCLYTWHVLEDPIFCGQ